MSTDRNHLTPKQITDVNGKQTTVHVNDRKSDGAANAQKLGGVSVPKTETLHEKQQRMGKKLSEDAETFLKESPMFQGKISVFVDRGDEMSDDEIKGLFNPGDDERDKDNDRFSDASRYDVETAAGEFLLTQKDNEELLEDLGLDADDLDYTEHDYDSQQKVGAEALNSMSYSGDVLRDHLEQSVDYDDWKRQRLSGSKEFMRIPLARYDGDYINGLSDGAEDRKAEWVERELRKTGYEPTEEDKATIQEIAANGPYDYHEGVTMEVFWHGDVADLEPLDYAKGGENRELSFKSPNILVMDPTNGSGFDANLEKPHTFNARVPFFDEEEDVTERKNREKPTVQLDRDRGGYSWDETAGLYAGAEGFAAPEVNMKSAREQYQK